LPSIDDWKGYPERVKVESDFVHTSGDNKEWIEKNCNKIGNA
jgi:hypothetical protein